MPDLVIASPAAFVPALLPLRDFKAATGVSAEIATLEDIVAGWPGRDDPERVKRFIEGRVRTAGTKYVFLVGDASAFPLRFTKSQHIEPVENNPQGGRVIYSVTDLYYADLFERDGSFDDWDRNGNGEFGELQGEWTAGTVNVDEVDLSPDVAVGRLPARTTDEVRRYVDRVIRFEAGMPQIWAKRALLIATTDWIPTACKSQEAVAAQYLPGFEVHRLYSTGNPCGVSEAPSATRIVDILNNGVGLVSYVGHGSAGGWTAFGTGDLAKLTTDRPPVVFATACDTSWFVHSVPYGPYVDTAGVAHPGVNSGEVVSLTDPPRPAAIQPGPPAESMGVEFLVARDVGAVAYLGCITGAQSYGVDLATFFFEGMSLGNTTLGDLWRHMVTRYYQVHVPPLVISPPDWRRLAEFHQPWKFFVFGDPSLRVRGVGSIGSLLSIEGVPASLRVNDVGTGYGPPDDRLDAEVVVTLEQAPGRGFGFALRADAGEGAHGGMLDVLRHAFTDQTSVRLDYVRTGFLNGTVVRVMALH